MKIIFDTNKNELKVGSKTFGIDMPKEKENFILSKLHTFVNNNTTLFDFGGYEEDSMWMSYRYCIGRHTIASYMRAGDIASHCYKRMSDERSIFTAYDINREIEQCMMRGCGPNFWFPCTSLNKIYTSAIDIFCQFVEDYNIQSKDDLLKYKDVHVKLADNERGYSLEVITWEEWLQPQILEICREHFNNECLSVEMATKIFNDWEKNDKENITKIGNKFYKLIKNRPSKDYFYLTNIDDLMVWNNLVHLFDIEHHHKSILTDGSEVEWYWTYDHDCEKRIENGKEFYYRKEIGYRKIRVSVDAQIGSSLTYIPDSSIKEDLY